MVIVDCGVEITGPLSARDYKDPGTDGLNKISAKMIPVINPTFALQGAGATSQSSQGSGWNEEVQFTLNTLDVHGVAQPVGFDSYNLCETGDVTQTLKSPGGGVTESIGAVRIDMAVRRLTPVECERLQGFPDGYTNIPWRKAAESPDGPRYKALGNSWAVPVVAWIGQRIQNQIK
jgi:DNA (cytosine-5)-methyltransferase 1